MQDRFTWTRFSFKSQKVGKDVEVELAVEISMPAQEEIHTVLIACHGKGKFIREEKNSYTLNK